MYVRFALIRFLTTNLQKYDFSLAEVETLVEAAVAVETSAVGDAVVVEEDETLEEEEGVVGEILAAEEVVGAEAVETSAVVREEYETLEVAEEVVVGEVLAAEEVVEAVAVGKGLTEEAAVADFTAEVGPEEILVARIFRMAVSSKSAVLMEMSWQWLKRPNLRKMK